MHSLLSFISHISERRFTQGYIKNNSIIFSSLWKLKSTILATNYDQYVTILPLLSITPLSLSKFHYTYAHVLPYQEGQDKGTWDAFGGKRDPQEIHPLVTAAREFTEESMLLFFTNEQTTRQYIDIKTGNTSNIIANKHKKPSNFFSNSSWLLYKK